MEKLKSIKLLLVYNEVLQVVSQLDATFLNLLKTSEGDVPANIKRRMEGIENKEYVVLVAGALTFYHHSKFFFLTQFDCDRSRDHYNAQIKQQLKVARYSFSRSIPPKFERKLRRHKQRFGKIDTTVVLDKEENWL